MRVVPARFLRIGVVLVCSGLPADTTFMSCMLREFFREFLVRLKTLVYLYLED